MGKTVQELLEWEQTEHRYNMIQKVLPYFEKYAKESNERQDGRKGLSRAEIG